MVESPSLVTYCLLKKVEWIKYDKTLWGNKSFLKGEVRAEDKKKETTSAQCPLHEQGILYTYFLSPASLGKNVMNILQMRKLKLRVASLLKSRVVSDKAGVLSPGLVHSVMVNFKYRLD